MEVVSVALTAGKRPVTYFIGGWIDPSPGMEGCGKFRPHGDLTPSERLTLSELL